MGLMFRDDNWIKRYNFGNWMIILLKLTKLDEISNKLGVSRRKKVKD